MQLDIFFKAKLRLMPLQVEYTKHKNGIRCLLKIKFLGDICISCVCLINKNLIILTAAGVVPCGDGKRLPLHHQSANHIYASLRSLESFRVILKIKFCLSQC